MMLHAIQSLIVLISSFHHLLFLNVSVIIIPILVIFACIVLSRTYFFDAWSVTVRPQLTNNGPLQPYLLSEAWC
jgi:hypothetical protein